MDEADLKLQKASPELIKDILRGISKILNHEVNQRKDVDRLVKVLDSFQEWPQLLDPHLSKLVPDLASALSSSLQQKNNEPDAGKDHADELSTQKAICEILYTVCKIRGSKVVTRFFSNEPKYIQTLLVALRVTLWIDQAQPEDCEERSTTSTWQERYIISLWLAHLVLTPFDLLSISPEKADIQLNEALTKSALPVIAAEAVALSVEQLFASSKESEAAKILLTRIALRSDMREYLLFDSLIRWILSSLTAPSSHEKLSNQMNQTYVHLGFLSLLAGLTISAEKAVIAPFLGQIYQTIYSIITQQTEAAQSILSSALTRKQAIKVLRSVVLQLESSPAPSELQIIGLQHESDEIIEVVVDHLLTSLADKDTPVRYAASKALSMITAKLEPAMAADIIEAVVESLEEQVLWDNQITGETLPSCAKENSVSGVFTRNLYAVDPLRWHGLVLTLSQMLLRRSPPPGQLGKILNALILALNFEQRSSVGKSVGVSVRDAACFGIWAIARQYSTEEIEAIDVSAIHTSKGGKVSPSMLQLLANELVVTATLDSAGNIRRGASAALQEMIGRHPDTIIEGIALVQAVDYHAVALRSRAAGHVALAASTLHNMYWSVIFAGLLGWRGVGSLDAQSRRETASAIGALSNGHLQTVLHGVRNKLRSTKKSQIEERHALLLALAAIVETLKSETLQITDDYPIWSRDGLGEIFDEVPHSQKDYASSALKSTLTAEAVCSLISAICHTSRFEKYLSRFLLASFDEQLTQRYDEVRWSLYDKSDLVRNKAVEALDELFYISSPQLQVSRATKWLADLNGKNLDSVKHGALMALGVAYRHTRERDIALTKEIPNKMLAQLSSINIYTRIWALRSLAASVLKTEGLQCETARALQDCLGDHTTDQRGDIGSLVRLEAIKAVDSLLKEGDDQVALGMETLLFKICGLAVEKLDRVRLEAYRCLQENRLKLPGFFESSLTVDFTADKIYFRQILSLLPYSKHPTLILEDFIVSASSGSESVLLGARAALAAHADEIALAHLEDLCTSLLNIIKSNITDGKTSASDRLLIPAMDVWGFLLEINVLDRLDSIEESEKYTSLVDYVGKARRTYTNVRKIEAAIKVYFGILSTPVFMHSHSKAATELCNLLLHQFPSIRNAAADALFMQYPHCRLLQTVNWTERTEMKKEDIRAVRKFIEGSGTFER